MKLEAPVTVRIDALNDWTYWAPCHGWQAAVVHVEAGWPPLLVVKVLGLGFRLEVKWGGP